MLILKIVDSMSVVLAATELFKEALHQLNSDNVSHKLNSLNLFIIKHVKSDYEVSREYIDLIENIVKVN
jgi:hypothetical protein